MKCQAVLPIAVVGVLASVTSCSTSPATKDMPGDNVRLGTVRSALNDYEVNAGDRWDGPPGKPDPNGPPTPPNPDPWFCYWTKLRGHFQYDLNTAPSDYDHMRLFLKGGNGGWMWWTLDSAQHTGVGGGNGQIGGRITCERYGAFRNTGDIMMGGGILEYSVRTAIQPGDQNVLNIPVETQLHPPAFCPLTGVGGWLSQNGQFIGKVHSSAYFNDPLNTTELWTTNLTFGIDQCYAWSHCSTEWDPNYRWKYALYNQQVNAQGTVTRQLIPASDGICWINALEWMDDVNDKVDIAIQQDGYYWITASGPTAEGAATCAYYDQSQGL